MPVCWFSGPGAKIISAEGAGEGLDGGLGKGEE